jgi:hypothetical protein
MMLEALQVIVTLGFLSGRRHGAAGVRWVEGGTRCAGDAAGAEMADHRRGHGPGCDVSRRWCRLR